MNAVEKYMFDLQGYIVLKNALSIEFIQELKNTLKHSTEQHTGTGAEIQGDANATKNSPLHWGKAWRDLLDIKAISDRLEDIIGNHKVRHARIEYAKKKNRNNLTSILPTYRLDHINVHTHVKNGFQGGYLHGGWSGTIGYYRYHNNHMFNGMISVSVELYDTHPNGGGFICIPGSHKSNFEFPFEPNTARWHHNNNNMPPENCFIQVPAKPGDVIIFTEALTHGTAPWTSDAKRSTIFYKYSPNALTWSSDFFDPSEFLEYDDMDRRKISLLEAPNARYGGRPTTPILKRKKKKEHIANIQSINSNGTSNSNDNTSKL